MLTIRILGVVFTAALISCAVSDAPPTGSGASDPVLREGYYVASTPLTKNVPLLLIVKMDGQTSTYGLLSYYCDGQSTAKFDESGNILTESASKTLGPSATETSQCQVTSEIVANADGSLHLNATVNGTQLAPYTLTATSKKNFVDTLRIVAFQARHFSIAIDVCQKTLGDDCDRVRLAAK